jgi:spermidine synthase
VHESRNPSAGELAAVALVSASLLMTELALTRIFSVVMYYHFAFLAISIALFGLSASGVFAYVARRRLDRYRTSALLAIQSLVYATSSVAALFVLVRLRVGLNYSPANLALMLTIYGVAALPFLTGGLIIALAVVRFGARINTVYAADLAGAALGCVMLIPLLDTVGAPGVVLTTVAMSVASALLVVDAPRRRATAAAAALIVGLPLVGQLSGAFTFDVVETKGHRGDTVLFSKWNSFSRVGVYDRVFGDWALSRVYAGARPDTKYMDIDSAASTPILNLSADRSNAQYLRYELTAIAYQLEQPGFRALVIGPGGGRDLASALIFGAGHIDAVEINPLIANDVMRGRFLEFSGRIYADPRVSVTIDDGRSFIRRSSARYEVIQASLVDTWAATAAGAYTLTENTLYTVEAFDDYLDHLSDSGVLTITRWVGDGLRLVSLAQAACERRGWSARERIAIVRQDRVATFLLKRTPFTDSETATLRGAADHLRFDVLYTPTAAGDFETPPVPVDDLVDGTRTGDYLRLIAAFDRHQFFDNYRQDVTPTTDDRPFFFHTTKLRDQVGVAFGRSMLFGNGLSALLTLMGISLALVVIFVIGPLLVSDRGQPRPSGWLAWLAYFGALGAGFMLIEVSVLQRFVLLLGHPVYSLTVTLFSLLIGTAIGSAWSRHLEDRTLRRSGIVASLIVALLGLGIIAVVTPLLTWAIPFSRPARMAVAVAVLLPMGVALGVPMPTGVRLLRPRAPHMVAWAWGINGALSVLGATAAIFIAMNWGFRATLAAASVSYLLGLAALAVATLPGNLPPGSNV